MLFRRTYIGSFTRSVVSKQAQVQCEIYRLELKVEKGEWCLSYEKHIIQPAGLRLYL